MLAIFFKTAIISFATALLEPQLAHEPLMLFSINLWRQESYVLI